MKTVNLAKAPKGHARPAAGTLDLTKTPQFACPIALKEHFSGTMFVSFAIPNAPNA